jgi:hypothetical protein
MFELLPKDLQLEIVTRSDPKTIRSVLLLNKHFNEFENNPLFWKLALFEQFGIPRLRIKNYEEERKRYALW